MRAKPGVAVQKIAASFGGGGHKAAAGCFVPKPVDGAREMLVPMLVEAVKGVAAS
jgi:nanoRNase/pAp phosphatase (c-di-AMP/oligoRNAs hydrolase)